MNFFTTLVNGAWWTVNGLWVASEVGDLKHKCEEVLGNRASDSRDYIIISGKAAVLACDILCLQADWKASNLEGMKLDVCRTTSANLQAVGMVTHCGVNVVEKGYAIDVETFLRLMALCRRGGQAAHLPVLAHGATAVEATGLVSIFGLALFRAFDQWYEIHGGSAQPVQFELGYDDIPEEHHDNPIFSQFICPITQCPIRYPVTAPNTTGGPDHHFERAAIVEWLTKHNTNPMNKPPLVMQDLRENDQMRKIIEDEMTALGLAL